MAKGYWIVVYHSISDPAKLAQYSKAAGPVIEGGGGRYLARGLAAKAVDERAFCSGWWCAEFESLEKATKQPTRAQRIRRR